MRIKINIEENPALKKELEYLLKYVQDCKDSYMQEMQEYFITVIYLLTNPIFREEIAKLRNKHHVPQEWYTNESADDTNFYKWLLSKKPPPPENPDNSDIRYICKNCKVNSKAWGEFVLDYFYFGSVCPLKPPSEYYINAKDEFRYKCRIETLREDFTTNTITIDEEKGYIRFFKDTTIEGLCKFAVANTEEIHELQKELRSYPYSRTDKYKTFKRDIQIYILFLLGYKIADDSKNTRDNLLKTLDESNLITKDDLLKKKKRVQSSYRENTVSTYCPDIRTVKYKIEEIEQRIQSFYR